ncbi:hypothetical protein LSAT2_002178, partial [Lamellibrachia satsuma]
RNKNRTKTLRKLYQLEEKLEIQLRETAKFKKRWQRLLKQFHPETPRSKTIRLLRCVSTSSIRKTLIIHDVLVDGIRKKYAATKQVRLMQTFCRLLTGSIAKKYRLRSHMQKQRRLSAKRWPRSTMSTKTDDAVTFCLRQATTLTIRYRKRIQEFYNRHDNSRITTEKWDTVTLRKNKQQHRLLNDSMNNLH